jgi:hypothetical protein
MPADGGLPLYKIGKITDQPEVLKLDDAVLDRKAFEHFR